MWMHWFVYFFITLMGGRHINLFILWFQLCQKLLSQVTFLITVSQKTWVHHVTLQGCCRPSPILIPRHHLCSSASTYQKWINKSMWRFQLKFHDSEYSFCILTQFVNTRAWVYKPKAFEMDGSGNLFFFLNPKGNLHPWKLHSRLGWICLDRFLDPKRRWKVLPCAERAAPPPWPAPTAIWALTAIIVSRSHVRLGGLVKLHL